jgi:hypothetical protein
MHRILAALLIVAAAAAPLPAQEYKLEKLEVTPEGLPEAVASKLDPHGVRVVGPRRALCEIWLVKEAAAKADFETSLAVKYPFTPGQFLGILQVPRRAELSDFRGQEIEEGLYTLRYGQQPMDGNHIGTSETADFLLALPVRSDEDPATIETPETLFKTSAEAAGTSHPAIFSLLPVGEAEIKEAGLAQVEDKEFWVLQLLAAGAGDKKYPLRLVVVGESEG